MGTSGRFSIFRAQESAWKGRTKSVKIFILSVLVLVSASLLFRSIRNDNRRREAAEKKEQQFASERVLSLSTQLIIGDTIEQGKSSLTVIDYINLISTGNRIKHGFGRSLPNILATGAGNEVAVPEPKIISAMLDTGPLPEHSVFAYSIWWHVVFGSKTFELPPGNHTFQVTTEVPPMELFSNVGAGSITFPLISPVLCYIDHAEANVRLPSSTPMEGIKFRGWIAKSSADLKEISGNDAIQGTLSKETDPVTLRSNPIVTFAVPRRLLPLEVVMVQVNW